MIRNIMKYETIEKHEFLWRSGLVILIVKHFYWAPFETVKPRNEVLKFLLRLPHDIALTVVQSFIPFNFTEVCSARRSRSA